MQRIVLALLALAAVVLSQPITNPQTGVLTINYLNSANQYTAQGSVQALSVANSNSSQNVQIYAVWIPENTRYLSVNFSGVLTGNCAYLTLSLNSESLPCNPYDQYNGDYVCTLSDNDYWYNPYQQSYSPGAGDNELSYFAVNKFFYFSVGRYEEEDYDETCTYSLVATPTSDCAQGQVGYNTGGSDISDIVCEPYVLINNGTLYSLNNTNASADNNVNIFKISGVPLQTASITITVNSSSTGGYVSGQSYAVPYSNNADCRTGSYSTSGNFYIYTLVCYVPRAGDFYVTYEDDNVFTATLSYTMNICAAGLGGFNCSSSVVALNTSLAGAFSTQVTVPYFVDNGPSDYDYGFSYFYFDIPANSTYTGTVAISAVQANSTFDANIYLRRNAFPDYGIYEDSDEETGLPATWYLTNFDWAVGGRIYFGLECLDGPACVINVTLSSISTTGNTGGSTTASGMASTTSTPTTTAMASTTSKATTTATTTAYPTTGITSGTTTGIPTTGVTSGAKLTTAFMTGDHTSSVSMIVPSFVALFAVVAALF